jgi:hypothetical protein
MVNELRFTRFFILYVLVYIFASLAIFLTASAFAEYSALAYLFFLLPFYLACIVYCFSIVLEYPRKTITLPRSLFYSSLVCQILTVLTSPADCYFWHQGRACYSFLQVHFNNVGFPNYPEHWSIVEAPFPIFLLLYIISIATSLGMLKVEGRSIL